MATQKTGGKSTTSKASKSKVSQKYQGKEDSSPPKNERTRPSLQTQIKTGKDRPVSKHLKPLPKAPSVRQTQPTPPKDASEPKKKPALPRNKEVATQKDTINTKDRVDRGPYDAIRQILESQKSRVLLEAQGIMGDELNAEDALPDLGDRASAETDQNFTLRLRERGQNLVKKINEAIERIDTGVFGICEVCGGRIAMRRLIARPVTTLCIECKTDQEKTERAKQ